MSAIFRDAKVYAQSDSEEDPEDQYEDPSCSPGSVLESKLEECRAASQRLRFRITLMTTVAGHVPCMAATVMYWLLEFFVLDPFQVGYPGYYGSMIAPGALLMLLGLMPNDVVLIRVLSFMSLLCLINVGLICMGLSAYAVYALPEIPLQDSSVHTKIYLCGDGDSDLSCSLFVSKYFIISTIWILGGLFVKPTLHRKANAYDFSDGAFKMPARRALDVLWRQARISFGLAGFVFACFAVAFKIMQDQVPWYTDGRFVSDLMMGIIWMVVCLLYTHSRRRRIMAFLSAVNSEGECMSAAALAALLGSRTASQSLSLARATFRSISFSMLTPSDFLVSRDETTDDDTAAGGGRGYLFSKTSPAKLSHCDAFISHSWSDDGNQKFTALQGWASEFKAEHGRYPNIWLDKACIDQQNISDSLLCLPVFTAGCDQLLILAGPTYTQRLWCIIELFVFLKMGCSIDRITVLPIGMGKEEDAKEAFASVDVTNGKCYLESDRQRLMAIIEQGFGHVSEFNEMVRQVFKERVTRVSTFYEGTVSGTLQLARQLTRSKRFRRGFSNYEPTW